MQFFAAVGLDFNERAGYPIRSGRYLKGGLLWSFRGSSSHLFFDPFGQS